MQITEIGGFFNSFELHTDCKSARAVETKRVKVEGITDKLIEKAEDFMDEAADKIYKSEPYRKAGNSMEKANLSIFRKAGKWWGKL